MIKFGIPENDSKEVAVSQVTVQYIQNEDCCAQSNGGLQILTIETQDGGGGVFYTISTERWAIDKQQDIIDILKDFEGRVIR